MAHFAELDEQNIVTRVIVVGNDRLVDHQGAESEELGIAFCKSLYGSDTRWAQTSYNANFRKNYAGIGYFYDPVRDAFIASQPYPSWTLDENTCRWHPPVPYPTDGGYYEWDETAQAWVQP
jgi:hypothetical protein